MDTNYRYFKYIENNIYYSFMKNEVPILKIRLKWFPSVAWPRTTFLIQWPIVGLTPHSYGRNLNIQRNIDRGIVATSIKYTKEDIENLLNREINLREKDILEENSYLSAIQGMPIT